MGEILHFPHDVDANPVAWREAGEGPVVLFLHGLGGSRLAWEPQLMSLSDRWRCVAWDMPGYGASLVSEGPLTFPSLAEAAVRLLDTLNAHKAALVGLSMGGMVGLHIAINHPDRLSSLVVLSSSPAFGFDGSTDADEWTAERLAPLEAGATPEDIAPSVLRSVAGPQVMQSVIDEAAAAMARISSRSLSAAVHCLTTHNVVRELHEISVPTLVAVGSEDKETPVSYSHFLADHIPGALYAELSGIGHLSNLEAPKELNRLLREFLSVSTVPDDRQPGVE